MPTSNNMHNGIDKNWKSQVLDRMKSTMWPVEDLFCVKNQTHIYLFSKEEWDPLLKTQKNFHTNEPLL